MNKTFNYLIIALGMVLFLAGFSNAVEEQDIWVLNLEYNAGNVSVQSIFLTKSIFYPTINQPTEGYNLSIVDFRGKVLYSQKFEFSLEIRYEPNSEWFDEKGNQIYFPGKEESSKIINKTNLELMVPYFENASKIEIRDKENKIVFSFELSKGRSNVEEKNEEKNNKLEDSQPSFAISDKKESKLVILWIILAVILAAIVVVWFVNRKTKSY